MPRKGAHWANCGAIKQRLKSAKSLTNIITKLNANPTPKCQVRWKRGGRGRAAEGPKENRLEQLRNSKKIKHKKMRK